MYVVQEFYSKLTMYLCCTLLDPPHPSQSIFEDPRDIQLVKALANSYLHFRHIEVGFFAKKKWYYLKNDYE